jgi:hypothetical protein
MSNLWTDFRTHQGLGVHKWAHYFPIYERHFHRYANRPVVFLEIGIGAGGSLQLWKNYLGPYAQIIGLDIADGRHCEEDQIATRVGDQSDPAVLQAILDEFGAPDVVLDDGSHFMEDIHTSFKYLYPRMSPTGVYMVEDLHAAYWPEYGGGLRSPASFIETCKGLIDELNADLSHGALPATQFTKTTLSIHFYDSVAVFERGAHPRKHALSFGSFSGSA